MGRRNHQNRTDSLSRLLVYMLGRRPDEFGLVPDFDGFVSYRDLLQAIHEEPGWSYVRRSNINEVLLGKDRALFHAEDKVIRALERHWRPHLENLAHSVPRLLFTAVRTRAHPVVMEKGLKSGGGKHLVLSTDRKMALRIGKRRDQSPVLLEIGAARAARAGILFYSFGDLFLSPYVPVGFISGPAVSKEVRKERKDIGKKNERITAAPVDFTPGSFLLDISRDSAPHRRQKNKKGRGWKEQARRFRGEKGK